MAVEDGLIIKAEMTVTKARPANDDGVDDDKQEEQ